METTVGNSFLPFIIIFSAGGNFSSKDTEILQKSTITLYLISDDTQGEANQFFR